MQRVFFLFLISLFSVTYLKAQHYKTAAGIRLGGGVGLTVQQYVGDKMTVEGIFSSQKDGDTYDITGLFERHFNVLTRRVNFYFGAGPHLGILKEDKVNYQNTFGISGIGGIEFTMKRLNFSLDYKPALNLVKGIDQNRTSGYLAISARYVIVEREKFTDRVKKKFKRKT